MADDWVLELRQLRTDLGPTIPMKAKAFPVRKLELLVPAAVWLLRRLRRRPRQLIALDVALYGADAGPQDLPVVLAPMPRDSWLRDISGAVTVEVAGRPEPGRAVALGEGGEIAFAAGPCREPTVFRSRYRL